MKVTPEFFDIDMNQLDVEWLRQPRMFFTTAEALAEARRDFEQAKSELDLTDAELDKAIRANPEEYGLPQKTTETMISKTIIACENHTAASDEIQMKKHRVDVLQAAVTALDHRKKALENLVQLHGQNYFSTPIAKGNSKDVIEEAKKIKSRRGKRRKRDA